MNRVTEIREIERRVRASMAYHDWTMRNRSHACIVCDDEEHLQVHHVVELYHILLGLWKLYGDADMVVTHAIAMHIDDHCECVTLCKKCHDNLHPGRRIVNVKEVRVENWCTVPRHLPGPLLNHPSTAKERGFTLLGIQTLCGIGWYVLNGYMESRIVQFKRSEMAALLDKKAGTSFNNGLQRALYDLRDLGVLDAWHVHGPSVEVHLSRSYLSKLTELPWFLPMADVHTGKMPVFALRWYLNLQSGKKSCKIGRDKLPKHLYLKTRTPAFVEKCVQRACRATEWANAVFDDEFVTFKLKRRGAIPIWSLRSIVQEVVREGS